MTKAEREKAMREHEQMIRDHNVTLSWIISSLDDLIRTLTVVRAAMVSACPDFETIETEMRRVDLTVTSVCNQLRDVSDTEDDFVSAYPYIEPAIDEALTPFVPYVRDDFITDDGSDLKTLPKPRRKRPTE